MSLSSGIHTENRWMITFAVMLGVFLSVMDASIVNVALAHMMGNFAQTLSAITWVATSYSIAAIIVITMTGWLSTLIGRKTLYLSSFVLFMTGSILCGTAKTFPQMIIYRVIQGIGGGALIPISQAILRETYRGGRGKWDGQYGYFRNGNCSGSRHGPDCRRFFD